MIITIIALERDLMYSEIWCSYIIIVVIIGTALISWLVEPQIKQVFIALTKDNWLLLVAGN